jgi:hypothetical protein
VKKHQGVQPTPAIVRLMRRIRITSADGCWEWPGTASKDGYGSIAVGSRTDGSRAMRPTHRVTFEHYVGSIPVGHELDHLCRNRSCCNPAHLEAVTHAENMRRSVVGDVARARQLAITHCPQGHPYDGVNLYVDPQGARNCRTCRRARNRARRAATRSEGIPGRNDQ